MSSVEFKNVSKSYNHHLILKNINFKIFDGEFVSFLGPSGCGKTTSLRIVAGLEKNTSGAVFIDDQIVSDVENHFFLPPEKRNLAMVFQSYAIWPHMNVFDNVAFPLKMVHKN